MSFISSARCRSRNQWVGSVERQVNVEMSWRPASGSVA